MSVQMNPESSDEVDYSDFEYDQFLLTTSQDEDGNGTIVADFEPLSQQGGLRPNQVAEIVYIELNVAGTAAEADGGGDSLDTIEQRGTFGINLSEDSDVTSGSGGLEGEGEVVNGELVNNNVRQHTKPEVLIPYRVVSQNGAIHERDFRNLTGRGPVIDANDDLTAVHTSVSETAESTDFALQIHVVYDLFEIDDSRTAFSVPN